MNKSIIFLFCLGFCFTFLFPAEQNSMGLASKSSNFSAGFLIGDRNDNLTTGLNVTSPFFLYDRVALRFSGEYGFGLPAGIDGNPVYCWFAMGKLGLIGVAGSVNTFLRFYGEGGLVLSYLPPEESTVSFNFGGYGHFGFEFLFDQKSNDATTNSYYIEIGATGIGSKADKLLNKPFLLNGVSISSGIRMYL